MFEETEELYDVISLDGLSYGSWEENEDIIIRPRLEEAGFYAIHFEDCAVDKFGVVTRVVTCIDNNGTFRKFIYG
jgi:hypothetical protein